MGYLAARIRSFRHAIRGCFVLVCTQPHARIHLVASLVVVVAGVAARLGAHDWASVVLAMACVWVAEAVNTAIEFAVDLSSPERNPIARNAKDVAAAAVLLASMAAVVVAGFIFGPWLTGQR